MEMLLDILDLRQKGVWIPLLVGTILLLFVILMPKRQMNWQSIYLTIGVVTSVGLLLDINIIGQYLDLIDLGEPTKEGLGDLFSYALIPSCLAVIYLNYLNQERKWLYVSLFIVFSLMYEWGLTMSGYMKLKGWQHWYSFIFYFVVYSFWLPYHLNLMRALSLNMRQNLQSKSHNSSVLMGAEPAFKPITDEDENEHKN